VKLAAFLCTAALAAAQTNPASLAARDWRKAHERAIVDEFFGLLSIPNVSSDTANVRKCADAVVKLLEKRGVAAKLVEVSGASPVVFGEIRTPDATRTIVFYAHYDGQPLDPKEWVTPPFAPVLRDKSLERDGQVISKANKLKEELKQIQIQLIDIPIEITNNMTEEELNEYFNSPKVNKKYRIKK